MSLFDFSSRLVRDALALTAALCVVGCSAGGAGDAPRGSELSGGCVPGQTFSCACTDGTQSVQTCNDSGTGLGPCECGPMARTGGVSSTGGMSTGGFGTGGAPPPSGSGGGLPPAAGTGGVAGSGGAFGGAAPGGFGGAVIGGSGGAVIGGWGGSVVTGGAGGAGGSPPATGPAIPDAISPCPQFVDGTMAIDVGGVQRSARVWVDLGATATLDGPVVFYWYGTGGQPSQATSGLGTDGIGRITAAGGIVVAPTHINSGTFPWIGGDGSDFLLMDQVVACAEEQIGIDETHIHSLGFSAGGLFTTQVSFARSSYVASVATYSGGGGGASEDPINLFPAMILFGGSGDQLVANFADTSRQYYDQLKADGHFALLCDHGGGHSIPTGARSSVVQFFFDHGFKQPSPYTGGFPPGFVSYCVP